MDIFSGLWVGLVLLLIGLFSCFVGQRFSRVMIFMSVLIAIFIVVYNSTGNIDNENTRLIIGAVSGLVLAIVSVFFVQWGPALLGLAIGIVIAMNFDFGLQLEGVAKVGFVVGVGVVCALLCLLIKNLMIKIITSVVGGALIVGSSIYMYRWQFQDIKQNIEQFANYVNANQAQMTIPLIVALCFAVLGVLVQMGIIPNPLNKR